MKLPNAHLAVVTREKIFDYLLNAAHPDNGGKAAFFSASGFTRENWRELASALRNLAQTTDATRSLASPHGRKYIIEGSIGSTGVSRPVVRSVWIIDVGQEVPRLVTAYPHEE